MKIYQQEQEKSSGSINVSFGARIFECFNMKTCSRGLIELSLQAFNKLKGLLGDKVKFRLERCQVAEHITPEIVMSIGLCYLSGGKCLDLKIVYGLSLPSVYSVRGKHN